MTVYLLDHWFWTNYFKSTSCIYFATEYTKLKQHLQWNVQTAQNTSSMQLLTVTHVSSLNTAEAHLFCGLLSHASKKLILPDLVAEVLCQD